MADVSSMLDKVPEIVKEYFKVSDMRSEALDNGRSTKMLFSVDNEGIDRSLFGKMAYSLRDEYQHDLVHVLHESISGFVFAPEINWMAPVYNKLMISVCIRND